jgi:hypothetical protein
MSLAASYALLELLSPVQNALAGHGMDDEQLTGCAVSKKTGSVPSVAHRLSGR